MIQINQPPANIIHTPNVGFHFIWKRDFESVARDGVLSRYFLLRLGRGQEEHIFKAQRQAGADLISIWDPWRFLRRHWRNRPLGSDNRPWDIIDFRPEKYFQDPQEIYIARAITDPEPAKWVGVQACQHPVSRKMLDRVRRKIVSLVVCAGPAPGLTEAEIHKWINREVIDVTHYDGSLTECEVCLLLSPILRRYDFPGYKRFENFVRFRIPPEFILGVVTNEADARHASFIGTVVSRGYQIYLTDGTELSPK
jgi:hypothetical protein